MKPDADTASPCRRVMSMLEPLFAETGREGLRWQVRALLDEATDEADTRVAARDALITELLQLPPEAMQAHRSLVERTLHETPQAREIEALAERLAHERGADDTNDRRGGSGAAPTEPSDMRRQLAERAETAIARNRQSVSALEKLISRLQLASALPELLTPNDGLIEQISTLAENHHRSIRELQSSLASLDAIASDQERLRGELNRVRALSLTDEGTGLPNRRAFLRQMRAEIARLQRRSGTFSIALLDIDHFKRINDRHGHAAGDSVLRHFAGDVFRDLRSHDLVARFGGEEFAIMLPGTPLDGAARAMDKMLARVRGREMTWQGQRLSLPTFSAGLSEYEPGDTIERLLERADDALYRAKHEGRDRVRTSAPPLLSGKPAEAPEHLRRGA